jgi:hypothetical protein
MKQWRKIKKQVNENGKKERVGKKYRDELVYMRGQKIAPPLIMALMQRAGIEVNLIKSEESDNINNEVITKETHETV